MADNFNLREELARCVKCGACMAVCPIYRQTGREELVARGKLALVERRQREKEEPAAGNLSAFYRQAIDHCLLCHACEDNCSKNVQITAIIKESRREITAARGLHPVKKALFGLLRGRFGGLRTLTRIGSWLQLLAWKRLPAGSGLRRRLPLPLIDDQTVIPAIPRRNLDDRLRRRPAAAAADRPAVFFYPGCTARYLTPELGVQTVAVLEKLGYRVVVPREWTCCGAVVEAAGDRQTAVELQQRNLRVLAAAADRGPATVVTVCATCGHTLKGYPLPAGCQVMDISEFLYAHRQPLEKLLAGKTLDRRLTYHDPCHLRRGQKITAEPRWLLRLLAGDNFVELRHPERCCGSGGSFGVTHKALSRQILGEKIADLRQSAAAVIASGCPGCLIQLNEGIQMEKLAVAAVHPVTLLAELLAAPPAGETAAAVPTSGEEKKTPAKSRRAEKTSHKRKKG
ncbi:MAG: (Fe-S)-binding protein [Deltaproteobacteria bacterium]|nr:(Fe-S)-binding protein [Deltaproteobacteria bacterium]